MWVMIPETKQGPNVITRCKQASVMAAVLKWLYSSNFREVIDFAKSSIETEELKLKWKSFFSGSYEPSVKRSRCFSSTGEVGLNCGGS